MPVWILVPAHGFPGQALLSVVERLREHGIHHAFASGRVGRCEGEGAVRVTAQRSWRDLEAGEVDALIVLDDRSGRVAASDVVRELLRDVAAAGRIVAGIGRGVLALAGANLVRGRPVAATPETADTLASAGAEPLLQEPEFAAGNIVTATERGAAALADDLDSFRGIQGNPKAPV